MNSHFKLIPSTWLSALASFVIFLFLFSSCDNAAYKGLSIKIDSRFIAPSDFSNNLIYNLKSTFRGKGMTILDSSDADYTLVLHSAEEYGYDGDEVTIYESCVSCETGDEVSYDESTAILYTDGYTVSFELKAAENKVILDRTITDEVSDKVKNTSSNSCSGSGTECEGTEVDRGLFSALDPDGKVSRLVLKAIRKNE